MAVDQYPPKVNQGASGSAPWPVSISGTPAVTISGTVPVSGTLTANIGTAGGLALDATLTGGSQKTQLVNGANVASISAGGALKVDNSGVTQPISAASLPLPTGAATSAKQPALGTAGTASTDVLTVQGIASMTALKVDPSGFTSPISGTVTANAGTGTFTVAGTVTANVGTTNGLALDATLTGGNQKTKLVDSGGVNVAVVSAGGALKVDGSGVTQPVSGTITANAGTGNFSHNLAQVNGSTVATAATGIQKVGLTDGSGNAIGSTTGSLNVNITGGAGSGGTSATDEAAWTAGTSALTPTGGVFNDTAAALTSGQQGTVRMTNNRGMHVNLRDATGTQFGTVGNPVNVNITGGAGSGGTSATDEATWTAGTSAFTPSGGVFNDSAAALTTGQQGTLRTTANRALHANLRDASGNALLGQAVSASSIPVVLASDQSNITVNSTGSTTVSTGTITTSASSVTSASTGNGAVMSTVTIHGTYAGISFNITVSDDAGTTFYNVPVFNATDNKWIAPGGTITPASNESALYFVPSPATGTSKIKVQATAYTSGTGNIAIRSSSAGGPSVSFHQGVIYDAAGNNRGANVTAGNALQVDASATTQPVSGTITANAGTGTFASNITQFGGTNVVTGTGVSGAGIPRVTVSNDSNVLATQSGTWTVQPGNTANTTPWLATINQGGNSATVTASNALKVDGSAVTQPVSGTITANIGTSGSLALDSSVNGIIVAQGSTTSGQKGGLILGAVTTSAPTYTTAQSSPLSLTTAGALRVDSSATTQPVSGTVAATQSGTWTVQPGNTANTTPWLTTINQGGNSATVTAGSALKVDGSAVTQPVSGTITANIGTTNGLALDSSVTGLQVSQGSTTSGQKGTLIQGAVTTSAPTYTTAQTSPLSLTTTGALRVDASATTQPVSGTVTANAGTGNFGVNITQVSGSSVATAATGIMKVGLADGTGNAIGSTSGALNVNIASGGGSGFSVADEAAWTAGTSAMVPAGAVFNDTATALTTGQEGTLRSTNNRALHTNIRNTSGTELATASNPLRVDPTGTTTQPVSGTVTANIGTTNGLALDTTLTGGSAKFQGNVASAATDSGNPVKVGGIYNATMPTFTDGQRGDVQLTTRGAIKTTLYAVDSNIAVTTRVDQSDGVATSASGNNLAVISRNTVFNGTTWDRMYGDATNGTWVNVKTGTVAATVSGTITANAGTGTFTNQQSNVTADYDTSAGTQNVTMFGLALPASGGAVAGGTSSNPIRIDPTGTTTQPVSGTITANAGTGTFAYNLTQIGGSSVATAATGIQKVGLTDGTGNAIGSTTGSLNVNITGGAGSGGTSAADEAAWTAGTSSFTPSGGVFNDSAAALTAGQMGTFRATNNRGLHVNLRNASGTEIGTSGNPISVSSNIAQINGSTIATAATGISKVGLTDGTGNAITSTSSALDINIKSVAAGATISWTPSVKTALSTTVATVSSAAGLFGGYFVYNPNSSVAYVQVFDTTGAVTLGTTAPTLTFGIPATSGANLEITNGVSISNGIKVAATTTASGSTAPTTGLDCTFFYH